MPVTSSCSALGLPPQLPLPDLPDEIPGSTPSDDESAPDSGLSDLFHSLGAGAGAEAGADNDRYYRGGVGGGSGARAGSGSLAPYATGTSSVRWAVVRIGATTLEISTEGHVKQSGLFQPASYGSPHPGTPYRVYTVYLGSGRREQYYVHDLVHKAFVGDPPHGWEVRHRTKNYGNNSLGNLTVMPANVGYPHFTPLVD
jgi:hypothetical protein